MTKSNDNVENPRINTRGYTKQICKQNDEMKHDPSPPTWINARTPDHAKQLLTKRIEAVLPFIQEPALLREWKAMNRNNPPSFPNLLHFAVERMNLRTVRRVEGQQNTAYIKRAKYQHPFSLNLEIENGTYWNHLQNPVQKANSINPTAESANYHHFHQGLPRKRQPMQNYLIFVWKHFHLL